jgi:hypothetical protein
MHKQLKNVYNVGSAFREAIPPPVDSSIVSIVKYIDLTCVTKFLENIFNDISIRSYGNVKPVSSILQHSIDIDIVFTASTMFFMTSEDIINFFLVSFHSSGEGKRAL